MAKLSFDQRRALAEFFANFAVAWLAAGIISPFISGQPMSRSAQTALTALVWASFSLTSMLYLLREESV